jgi:hypothetical protein
MKGQSAIEYLTTYGWMLLVIAIVGGAIFSTVQNSAQVQDASGLTNADVQVNDFGLNSEGLQLSLRSASQDQVNINKIEIKDEETGRTAAISPSEVVPIGDTTQIELKEVYSTETSDSYDMKITYDTGGLEGLVAEGKITGNFRINPFLSEPKKSFIKDLNPEILRNEYEPKGLTNVLEVGKDGGYSDIQKAVNNAAEGDSIVIKEGEYDWENVSLNKDVHIIGEGNVILNGSGSETGKAFVIGSGASPVIKGMEISDYSSTAVDAYQTSGNWAVADLKLNTGGSDINAVESKGDWIVLDSEMGGGTHYTNINAPRAAGDILIEQIYVRSGQYPINLNGADGTVNIRYSNIGGARGVYYEAKVEKSETVIKIRDTYFTGNYNGAINAADNAPEVDAKDNYWDESDYDSVQDDNVDSSNPKFASSTSLHPKIPK